MVDCMRKSANATLADLYLSRLVRMGRSLLSPDNMFTLVSPRSDRLPFAEFARLLDRDIARRVDLRDDKLLRSFLDIAEDFERRQSKELLNGGACYWRIIVILKV